MEEHKVKNLKDKIESVMIKGELWIFTINLALRLTLSGKVKEHFEQKLMDKNKKSTTGKVNMICLYKNRVYFCKILHKNNQLLLIFKVIISCLEMIYKEKLKQLNKKDWKKKKENSC